MARREPRAASSPTCADWAARPRARGVRGAARLGPAPRRAGWTCLGWPEEHGGRGLQPGPAGDLPRGVRPRRRAGAGQPPRRAAARPDADRVRHRRAEGTVPAGDPRGRRAVVPGLLRARRRLRPRRRDHHGAARQATASGSSTARRCGPRWRTRPTGASCSPAPSRARSATTACPTCWCRWTRPASRCGRSGSSPATRSSTRSSSTAPAPPPTWSSASPATAGGSRWRCSASSAASRRSASRSASSASSTDLIDLARDNGVARRPGRRATGSPRTARSSRSCGSTRSAR